MGWIDDLRFGRLVRRAVRDRDADAAATLLRDERPGVLTAALDLSDRVMPTSVLTGEFGVATGNAPAVVEEALAEAGMKTGGAFAPGRPIDQFFPRGSEPRQWDYPTGYNIVTRPRSSAASMSFATMRAILENYDVARLCIERREDLVRSLPWSWVPSKGHEEDGLDDEIAELTKFFEKPDGVTPFDSWQQMALEDLFGFDAMAISKARSRTGKLAALEVIDGTTLTPLIDYWGRPPRAPAPGFVQFVHGVPAVWLQQSMDTPTATSLLAAARARGDGDWFPQDVIYLPFRGRPSSPYGFPPVEWLMLTINTDVRWQWHFLQFFTEGSVPDTWMNAPPDITNPDQLREWQTYYDEVMVGDQSQKHKVKWIPAGANPKPAKTQAFDPAFPTFLLKKTVAAFKLTPSEIGFTDDVNRATAEVQENVTGRAGTGPVASYLEGIYSRVAHEDFGYPLDFQFDQGGEKEDRLAAAQAAQIYVNIGAIGTEEVRVNNLGLEGDPDMLGKRFVMTPQGPVPLEEALGLVEPEPPAALPFPPGAPAGTPPASSGGPDAGQAAAEGDATDAQGQGRESEPDATKRSGARLSPATQAERDWSDRQDRVLSEDVTRELFETRDVFDGLRKWRDNSRTRIRRGQAPKAFDGNLPAPVYAQVWRSLEAASSDEEVRAAFTGPFYW